MYDRLNVSVHKVTLGVISVFTAAYAAEEELMHMAAAAAAASTFFIFLINDTPYLYKQTAAKAADRVCFLSFKDLSSVRTYTYHAYMAAYELFKTSDIALAVCGKLVEAPAL